MSVEDTSSPEPGEQRKKKASASYADIARTWQVMQPHITKVDGFAVYEDGWDDIRVSEAIHAEYGAEIPVRIIGSVREQMVGKMKPATKAEFPPEIEAAFRAIEERMAKMDARMDGHEQANATEHEMINHAINGIRQGMSRLIAGQEREREMPKPDAEEDIGQ